MTGKLTLEERVRQLEDELARMKRESDDTLSNLDTSNLGSGLANRLNTMQSKTNALAGVISVDGTTVTIKARKIIFQTADKQKSEDDMLGYAEMNDGSGRWHLPFVYNNLN